LLESRISFLARTIGQSLAEKISATAQNWGYGAAKSWATDRSFALYLAVTQANK